MKLGHLTPYGHVSPIRNMFGPRVRFFAEEAAPEWIANTFDADTAAVATKDPEVIKYKDQNEFYKGYRNKVELLGRKGVIIPKEGDAPEITAKYREALGIPEKPDGYKLKIPDKLHASIKVSPEFENNFKAKLHARGLSQSAAEGLFQDYLTEISTAFTKRDELQDKTRLEGLNKLNAEWGKDTEGNIALARKAAIKVLGEEGFKQLGDFANNPQAARLLYGLTKMLSEDAIKSIGGTAETALNANAEIERLTGANLPLAEMKKLPFWDENHPKHAEAVKRRMELYNAREAAKNAT